MGSESLSIVSYGLNIAFEGTMGTMLHNGRRSHGLWVVWLVPRAGVYGDISHHPVGVLLLLRWSTTAYVRSIMPARATPSLLLLPGRSTSRGSHSLGPAQDHTRPAENL